MLLKSKIYGVGSHTLVVLHGFLGMSDNWKSYANKMTKNGFKVHLIDQRNHGDSFHNKDFNYEILANDLKHYVNHYNIKNFSLIGHSMGGKTAMMFSSLYQENINKLIIVDILPIYYKNDYKNIIKALKKLDFHKISSRLEADIVLSKSLPDSSFRAFLLKNLFRKNNSELAFKINLDIIYDNLSEIEKALSSDLFFQGKTLFVKGDKSNYINDQNISKINKQFPNFKLVNISNAGHWVHAENLKDFVEETLNFLKS
ncbi:MAG: alpha/beta fold hydrolase [Flavobacteriales bacterium]|jgi:esterase|tara:strand:- start:1398 stop:2168 length:771 start_codon:yes stop_codon:yes gene_type:complete